MTEYWVSKAKHWCEFCRIFIDGSKASIAFHENGKKHKEIVELSLRETRKRGREQRQENSEMAKEMAKIERAALKDYVAHDIAGVARPRVPAGNAKHEAMREEIEQRIRDQQQARALEQQQQVPVPTHLPSGWRMASGPDGRPYYVHDETGARQWEPPGGSTFASAGPGPSSSTAAPPEDPNGGWKVEWNSQGVLFYYHAGRAIAQWEEPPELRPSVEAEAVEAVEEVPVVKQEEQQSAGGEVKTEDKGSSAAAAVNPAGRRFGPAGDGGDADDADDFDDRGDVDANTGLGAWSVVEEPSMPEGGWGYDNPRGEKRQKPSWADGITTRAAEEAVEEEERLEDLTRTFAVSDEVTEAIARQEAAKAAEEAALKTEAPVFAKRKSKGGGPRPTRVVKQE